MKPSLNAMALVRAFDLITPSAEDKDAFRIQSQLFLDMAEYCVDAVASLVSQNDSHPQTVQDRFDALLSLACDVGIETLLESPIPPLLGKEVPKSLVCQAFLAIPAFEDTLRDELKEQLQQYRLPLMPRRRYELELFYGNVFFRIGRTVDCKGAIVYAPSVLHPMYRFFMASSKMNRK